MNLFFDLDGTLTDSAPGIVACINHALVEVGHACAPEDQVRALIGVPLQVIFERLLASPEEQCVRHAITAYRERFAAAGMFENALFPGVLDALSELQQARHHLQIVTVKPAVIAARVLRHFRLDAFFAAVHGPEPDDENCHKSDFVAAALQYASCRPEDAVMIGDRVDDVRAARTHGVPAVAVRWGYEAPDQLLAAGAAHVVSTPAELVEWVRVAATSSASR